MGIIRKSDEQHIIYEHSELEILIAINKEDVKTIKTFWKNNKGKSSQGTDKIEGHKFIFDEEQGSLKIDFENLDKFEIRFLSKYA
jgi:hypothetical protein